MTQFFYWSYSDQVKSARFYWIWLLGISGGKWKIQSSEDELAMTDLGINFINRSLPQPTTERSTSSITLPQPACGLKKKVTQIRARLHIHEKEGHTGMDVPTMNFRLTFKKGCQFPLIENDFSFSRLATLSLQDSREDVNFFFFILHYCVSQIFNRCLSFRLCRRITCKCPLLMIVMCVKQMLLKC